MFKDYDKWNEVKKDISNDKKIRLFKAHDILFIKMEQNKGEHI